MATVYRTLRRASEVLLLNRIGFAATVLPALLALIAASETALVAAVLVLLATLIYDIVRLNQLRIPLSVANCPTTVLVVAAHPDDLEIACGATVAKFVDSGHRVLGLIMTDGAEGGDAALRPGEARAGAEFLGMTELRMLDLPDRRLEEHCQEMVAHVEEIIRLTDPDLILTHSENEVHQDHAAVHTAVLRAARNHHSILCFESPSVTSSFSPSIYIDVSGYRGVKRSAIAANANQADKPYMSDDVVDGITAFRGRQARVHRAEAFEVVRLQLNQPIPL